MVAGVVDYSVRSPDSKSLWEFIAAAFGGDEQLQPCVGAKSVLAARTDVEVAQQGLTYRQRQLSVDQRPQSRPDNRTAGIDERALAWALVHVIRF